MKQLSALGARRHAFFRSPRRMRPLVDRLEPGELIPNGPFSFYGGGYRAPPALPRSVPPCGDTRGAAPGSWLGSGRLWPPSRPVPRRPSRGPPHPGAGGIPASSRCSPGAFGSAGLCRCPRCSAGRRSRCRRSPASPVARFPLGFVGDSPSPPPQPRRPGSAPVPSPLGYLPACYLPSVSPCPPDYQSEYYGPGSNYDFFPQGPPSSQAQTPVDLPFVPSSGPSGTPLGAMDHPLPGHHPSSEAQRFTDIMSHPPGDSPSPEPNLPGSLHSMSAEVFGPSPPFSSISVNGGANYGNHLSHPPEMNEAAVW